MKFTRHRLSAATRSATFGICAFVVLLATSLSHAQAPADNKKAAPIQASRYINPESLKDYIASMGSIMVIKQRPYDPFGQSQDPNAKTTPTEPTPGTIRRHSPIKPTSLTEIVRGIQVTTIMPGEGRFLIGTRSFKKGDTIPITFRGRPMKLQVAAVNATKIDFTDVDSGEVASVSLNLLPAGMSAGANGVLSAPGMQPDNSSAPIEIEGGASAP